MTQPPDGERFQSAWRALADDADATQNGVEKDASGPSEVSLDDAIWRAVAGESSAEERARMVDLVARDPAAAESWRVAQELQRELERREPAVPTSSVSGTVAVSRGAQRYSWIAMAAAVLLAVGLGWWQLGPKPFEDGPDVYRQSTTIDLHSVISEDEAQPRDQVVLSWSDAGPDARYSVRVLGADLEPLIDVEELTSTSVELPPEPLASVADGERLLWQVEARTPDGQTVTSPTYFLYLMPVDQDPAMFGSTPDNDPSRGDPS